MGSCVNVGTQASVIGCDVKIAYKTIHGHLNII